MKKFNPIVFVLFLLFPILTIAQERLRERETQENNDEWPEIKLRHDYLMDESVKSVGKEQRPVNVDEPSYFAADVFSPQDTYIKLDEVRISGGARLRTFGPGTADDRKDLNTEIITAGSLHLFNEFLTIFISGATGPNINSRKERFEEGKSTDIQYHVRNLSTTLAPWDGISGTAGSFAPYYALGTQANLKDKDTYLTGYRLQIDLKELFNKESLGKFIEKITAESTFYGDETQPDVFQRLERLSTEDNNAHGGFVESVEFLNGVRVAIGFENFKNKNYIPVQGNWTIDHVFVKDILLQSRIELDHADQAAYAIHAKVNPLGSLHDRLLIRLGATFSSQDDLYPVSDKYPAGERFDITISYALPYGFSIGGFYSDEFKDIFDGEKIYLEATVNVDPLTFYDEIDKRK